MNRVNVARMGTAAMLSLVLVACGQAYTPTPGASVPGVQGGRNVLGGSPDSTIYRTASYEVLRYTLLNTLNIQAKLVSTTFACGTGVSVTTGCPGADPVEFLDANRGALGVPVYSADDPLATQAPTQLTSAGFKVWDIAASSACGRMVSDSALYVNGQPVLFPDGNFTNYTTLYVSLLGRMPTAGDLSVLSALQASMGDSSYFTDTGNTVRTGTNLQQAQGAAACAAVLGSMEFLTAN